MLVWTSKSAFKCFLACGVLAVALVAKGARAEEGIIRQPGAHPNYAVEIEPHLLAALLMTRAGRVDRAVGCTATAGPCLPSP